MEFTSYRDRTSALAVDFINTYGLPSGSEKLTDCATLKALFERHHASYHGPITDADLVKVRDLRERLRQAFTAGDEHRAVEVLNDLLDESEARPHLTNHDGENWHLHFASDDSSLLDWLTAYTAMGLAIVIADEGFDRLKVCEGERCEDVFVDMSKNRSRRYCSAEVCGNRASVAAYRQRKRAAEPASN